MIAPAESAAGADAATDRVRAGGRVFEVTATRTARETVRPIPTAGSGEVVIRPRAVGICGTDLHTWRGRSDRLPIVPTHDGVGVVTSVGADVDERLLGSRVVIDPVDQCGTCTACRRGHPGVCVEGGYLGMTVDGLLAEAVALPAARVVIVPDGVDDVAATVLEPVAIGFRLRAEAATRGIEPGACVVIGGGPLGQLVGRVLALGGWTVTVEETNAARRERCVGLGLRAVAPGTDHGPRATLVVDTAAVGSGTESAFAAAHPGSLLVLLGRSPAELPAAQILLRELDVVGVRGGSGHYAEAVAAVDAGLILPGDLVDARFHVAGLPDLEAAFAAHDAESPPLRTVIHLSPNREESRSHAY